LDDVPDTGLGIYTQVGDGAGKMHICNLHGIAKPGDKLDTPQRLRQSKALIDFFDSLDGRKIIGGDFNLSPDTDSIRSFEEHGYINLIKEFGIRTTRNRLAWELYPDNKQYHSDYVLISPDVKVRAFEVPNNEVSDHLPLILDVEN
jgi:endonuclease/exonuclease/phosphatase family metal-dependent hydrolase